MMNITLMKLRKYLLQYSIFQKIKKIKVKYIKTPSLFDNEKILDDAEHIIINWGMSNKKPFVGIVKNSDNVSSRTAWPKYQRLLIDNDISYEFYKINESNWYENAKKYDIIIWQCDNQPSALHMARSKIYVLEKYLKKVCFPSFFEIWFYEDKIRQNYLLNEYEFPTIETFVSSDKDEAMRFINTTKYPLVSKITAGSGSLGVELVKNRKNAIKMINKIFNAGRKTYWTEQKQKDYVYFQQYLANSEFDLRVIAVDNKFFGYYRMKPKRDFRASGAGIYIKKGIPEEALFLAKTVKEKYGCRFLAVDMLQNGKDEKYQIIETSVFIGIDTAEQLKVDDKAGFYEYIDNKFVFKPGKYWIQELVLKEIINEWINKPR